MDAPEKKTRSRRKAAAATVENLPALIPVEAVPAVAEERPAAFTAIVLPGPGELFPDGIYFGLPEEPYHADPALGSTQTKTLSKDPTAYWWDSAYNPNRPAEEEDKAHLSLGSAVHKFVLEGAPAFHALYVREPVGDDVLVTSDAIGAWLRSKGADKLPTKKADRIQLIRDICLMEGGPEMPRIYDLFEAEAAMAGATLVKAADFDRIIAAGNAIKDNPALVTAFEGGYPEVSVFWTETVDGESVRRKARIDYLKPRAMVDLKSSRPRDGMTFVESCRRSLAEYNYPAQAAGYMQGRDRIPEFIAEGRVFGEVDPAWLERLRKAPGYGWVFVFWSSSDAPQVWAGTLSIGSELLAVAEGYVSDGLRNFVAWRRGYGLDRPWIAHPPLEEIELEHLPKWYGTPR